MGRMYDALKAAEATRSEFAPESADEASEGRKPPVDSQKQGACAPRSPGKSLAGASGLCESESLADKPDARVGEPPLLPPEPPSFLPGSERDQGEEEEEEQGRPFIEVGPHRSLEGSADVLAAPPPAPFRSVAFRQVPVAGGSFGRGSRIAAEVVTFHQPAHPASAPYRDLLGTVQAALPSRGPSVLLFSGARAGAGTTTVVLNLAVSAAQPGRRRIAVVDAHERRPAVAARLGLTEAPGLAEVLAGSCSLEKALRPTEQADLFALPAGLPGATAPLRFQAETLGSLVRRLRQQFDLVFVDGPAWGHSEAIGASRACDAVFLVAAAADAGSPLLDDLFRAVPEQGARLAGCVVASR